MGKKKEEKVENEVIQELEKNEIVNGDEVGQEEKKDELIEAKAKVCLKYNSKYIEIGQKFEVNKNNLNEMLKKNLVEEIK